MAVEMSQHNSAAAKRKSKKKKGIKNLTPAQSIPRRRKLKWETAPEQ